MAGAGAGAAASQPSRRTADFHPSVWRDFFITHVPQPDEVITAWNERIEVLKSNVRSTLLAPGTALSERLSRIDTIERLGIGYHFEGEIEGVFGEIYDQYYRRNDDLNTVALRFRLLRQHNYAVSSDVFKQFKKDGGRGEFKKEIIASDIKGMLNLYEAAYLRTEEDAILDEAIEFTKLHLMNAAELESPMAELVAHSLEMPLRKGVKRVEHLFFIPMYEKFHGHDVALLELAKLSFNVVQDLYQKELKVLTEWWVGLDLPRKLPYARDKLVEIFFWAMASAWEPKFALARYFYTKVISIGSMYDDTYDAYGYVEELELFTTATEKWDPNVKDLNNCMKTLFDAIIGVYEEIDTVTSRDGMPYCLEFGKQALKFVTRMYMEEARWFYQDHVPSLEEYRQVSSLSTIYQWIAYATMCGLGRQSAPKEAFDWLFSLPKMLVVSSDHCRLRDDMVSHEFEQKRGHAASSIQCYMKEHGVGKEEAMTAVRGIAEDDWKIMNGEILRLLNPPTGRDDVAAAAAVVPNHDVLQILVGLANVMETLYKEFDGYTNSDTSTKDMLMALFVTPFPV
ncbi:unnamed protein product [Linum trigynum]|uniref:Uncharacterized protein n=1 Tax=Linum trigynum TaxID=586398 RepID=A0AAV2EKN1_9ROSI